MEEIASSLKLSEAKQRIVREAHESFSVKWKELEDHFDSVRNSLQAEFQQLQDLKNETGCQLADLEAKAKECQGIVEEVEQGKAQLNSPKLCIQEHCEESEDKEIRLGQLQKLVRLCELEYCNTQQRCKEVSKEIESKERQLNSVQIKVTKKWKEFDLKDEEIRAKQELIERYDKEIKSKEEKLALVQKLMMEYSNTLESKMKCYCSLEESLKECERKIEMRDMELKRTAEKLEEKIESKVEELDLIDRRVNDCLDEVQSKEKHLDSREKHVDALERSMQECVRRIEQEGKELELKQQQVDSIIKSAQEQPREQKTKENADILHSQVKVEELEYSHDSTGVVPMPATIVNQSSINRDGRSLQLFLNDYFRRTDLVSSEVSVHLQTSSDPAKLVLDAMQGFYPSNSTAENSRDLSVIRRSCIHLLKELKRVSPQVNVKVREEAKKLASEWKAKMIAGAENWLEVVGLLCLLTAYDLTSTYDAKELQNLCCIAAGNEQSAELYGIPDITHKAPGSSIIGAPIKIEKPESSLGKNATTVPSPTLQLTATTDARNLQGLPNDHLSGNYLILNGFFQIAIRGLLLALSEDAFVTLLETISQHKQALENLRSFVFGDKIPDSVPKLIERKKLVEAVRVICTFNLIDMFPLVRLLKKYVKGTRKCSKRIYTNTESLDEKDNAVDNQIDDLRDVIQCIKDYNLESEYPSRDIEIRITRLQKRKETWRRCDACPVLEVNQEQKKGQKRFASNFQEHQRKSKCQLTAVPGATPYA